MKTRFHPHHLPLAQSLTALLFALSPLASAGILYWDGTSTGADADGGDGIWNTSLSNWDTAATGGGNSAWPGSGTDNDAVFGGAAGIVSIDAGGVTANDITFNTTGYLIQSNTLTLNGTTPLITAGSSISATISSAISGTVTKRGAGTLTLSGNSTATLGDQHQGVLEVQAGTWDVGTGFRLTAQGDGTLTLKNSGTKVTSAAGTLILTSASTARTATLNIQDGAEMKVNGTLQTNRGSGSEIGQVSVLNTSKLTITGGLDVGKNLGGANDRSRGAFTSNGTATVSVTGTTRLSNSGDNNHGTATLSVLGSSKFTTDTLELRPRREKGANILAVVNNTATLTATNGVFLTTADRVSSNVATTTTLRVAGSGTLETPGITSDASVGNTTLQLQLQGGTIKALGDNATFITGFSAAPVINASGVTFNSNGFDIGINVGLSGSSGFVTKIGDGTMTFLAGTTYAGSTTISEGTLALGASGSIAGSTIDVQTGASFDVSAVTGGWSLGATQTLKGNGTVIGNFTVTGTVAPGASIGVLDIDNNLTFGVNSDLDIEYDGLGLGSIDRLAVGGALDISNATVNFSQFGAAADDAYYIFATYGSLTGTFAGDSGIPSGYQINYAYNNGITNKNIALVLIPEPAAALLAVFGLLPLALRRRR